MGEVEILLKEKQNDESGTEQQAATVQSDGPNQNSAKAGNGERSSQEYQHSAADTTESNATAQSDESGGSQYHETALEDSSTHCATSEDN